MSRNHLGKSLEDNNWEAIRNDLNHFPVENTDGMANRKSILNVLDKYGMHSSGGITSVTIWGTGSPLREFMYSQDMAEACIYIMENAGVKDIMAIHKSGKPGSGYYPPHFINIGTGKEITVKDLAFKIRALTGFSGEIVFDHSKPDGTMRKITDISALKGLGFKHTIELDEGLKITYDEYLKRNQASAAVKKAETD